MSLHRCRSCNKMIKPNAGDCCVLCSFGSVKCNGEQNRVNTTLSSSIGNTN